MRIAPQILAFTETSEIREWLEQLVSKLWFPTAPPHPFIYFFKSHPLHFLLIKDTKAQGFCFLDSLVVFCLFPMFHFFCFYWVSTPTDFWVISNTCRHIKCLHFIWNLTWGESCSSTFYFLTVNNNAVISYLQNSFLSCLHSCGAVDFRSASVSLH